VFFLGEKLGTLVTQKKLDFFFPLFQCKFEETWHSGYQIKLDFFSPLFECKFEIFWLNIWKILPNFQNQKKLSKKINFNFKKSNPDMYVLPKFSRMTG